MIPAGRIEPPAWMADAPTVRLFAALAAAGVTARFVGGCVRNAVLGRPVDDLDLAVDRPPDAVMRGLEA
ncbi:MAG TPA: CCA tRNA nucleotidyltransferase, partial [Reyranella sp.]|nr:CCA tRNA nucleotidyltransferase [Reyranella sp.]